MAAVVSVRSGKQLRAAVSLVKLCCFLYFLSVSESRALRASAANVLLSGFLTKPRCQSFPKGPVRWLCPDWPLLSSLPFVFSQTESLPNAGSSSQEHWLSTGTPEQPFVASWKERCFLARGNCLSASGEDGPAVLRPGFLLTPLRVERLEFTFVVRKSHRCPAVKLSSSVPGGTIAGAEGPPPVLGLPGAGKVGSWCPGCVPRWMVRDPRKSRGTFIHLPESELRKHLHVL